MKEENLFNFNDKINSNNDILIEIVNDLQQLMNNTKDNLVITTLGDIINKINSIISENKNNLDIMLLRNDIDKMYNQMNKKFDELNFNINTINKKEIKNYDGRYIGQIINGLRRKRNCLL